jgi:hypothetical protein
MSTGRASRIISLLLLVIGVTASQPAHAVPSYVYAAAKPKCTYKLIPPTITWTFGITSSQSAGVPGQLTNLKAAIAAPVAYGAPSAVAQDSLGNPIVINGTLVTFTASPADSVEVNTLFPQVAGMRWYTFRSASIPSSGGSATRNFDVKFQWSSSANPSSGSGWMSDNGDDLFGNSVTDAFIALAAPPVPGLGTGGAVAAVLALCVVGYLTQRRRSVRQPGSDLA